MTSIVFGSFSTANVSKNRKGHRTPNFERTDTIWHTWPWPRSTSLHLAPQSVVFTV